MIVVDLTYSDWTQNSPYYTNELRGKALFGCQKVHNIKGLIQCKRVGKCMLFFFVFFGKDEIKVE